MARRKRKHRKLYYLLISLVLFIILYSFSTEGIWQQIILDIVHLPDERFCPSFENTHRINSPPFTSTISPVTKAQDGESSMRTTDAISLGSAIRPKGVMALSFSATS